MTTTSAPGDSSQRYFFDPSIAGKRVQADGGNAAVGSRLASRESFEGTLTGRRMDDGDPPWRWFEIGTLIEKPADFGDETVWCEESYIYPLPNQAEEVS